MTINGFFIAIFSENYLFYILIYIDTEHYFRFAVFMDDKKNEKMATVSLPQRAETEGDGGREREGGRLLRQSFA